MVLNLFTFLFEKGCFGLLSTSLSLSLSLCLFGEGGAAIVMKAGLQSHDLVLSSHSAPWSPAELSCFLNQLFLELVLLHSFPCFKTSSLILAALQVSHHIVC